MINIDKNKISNSIKNLKNARILVVGDFAIDEMIYGQTARISREAPVLILKHSHTKVILGAASNAAHNISTLNDGKVSVIGVYGDDYHAPILLDAFNKAKVDASLMVQDKERSTITKTRISGFSPQSVTQQIVRIDREENTPISKKTEDVVIDRIIKAIPDFDAVLLSDYDIGMMTPEVIDVTIKTAKKHGKIVSVDTQQQLERFKGATVLTPNQPDAEKSVGYFINSLETAIKAGYDLREKANSDLMLLTRGDEGMIVFEKDSHTVVPAFNKTDVFDVTGAGDTVVAAFTLALATGSTPAEAAIIGNLAASIVIRQFGCATTTRDELESNLEKLKI